MTLTFDDLRIAQEPAISVRQRVESIARAGASWLRRNRWDVTVLGAIVMVATWFHLRGIYVAPSRHDDEGTYIAQAWAVQQGRGLAHYTYWYDHPPVGWFQIAWLEWLVRPFHNAPNAIGDGRIVIYVFKVGLCIAAWVLCRRLGLRRTTTAAALLLMTLSPLAIVKQRMVLLDNIEAFWIIAAFAVAARKRLSVGGAALTGVLFGIGALSKETGLILLPALLLLVWQRVEPSTRRFAVALFLTTASFVVCTYPLFAVLRGELFPGEGHVSLWEGVAFQLWERAPNGPIWDGSTMAGAQVQYWFRLDPFLLAASAFVVIPALFMPRLRAVGLALAIKLLMALRNGYLPTPYVIMVIPFAAIVVAGVAEAVVDLAARLRPTFRGAAFDDAPSRPAPEAWRSLRPAQRVISAALVVALAIGAGAIARDWSTEYEDEVFAAQDDGATLSQQWIEENVPRDKKVVVDDAIWLDLVNAGFPTENVIWFWKVDLSPEIDLTDGYKTFDYAVLRGASDLPTLEELIANSEVVGVFGGGADSLTVYRVVK